MELTEKDNVRIYGIRHHGPGSARSLRAALERRRPDVLLVEGPPEADEVIRLAHSPDMKPPVALLVYPPDQPRRAVFYPFAEFSPEWQTVRFALENGIALKFMDLPATNSLALSEEDVADDGKLERAVEEDPIQWLARAAGYEDGERWWERMVEERLEGSDVFAVIAEAMTDLRSSSSPRSDPSAERERLREASMRRILRGALRQADGHVAVVCGAWHVPALVDMPAVKEDDAILKGLPRAKVQMTWVPWTYGRLTLASGYGAGVHSPGWYDHLWRQGEEGSVRDLAVGWLTRVARLLRDEDLDASSAHVIEAVRLVETLAAVADRPLPGLAEMNDAVRAVFTSGDDMPMRLIHERLVVGERMGRIPEEAPTPPLMRDLERLQKSLRMKPSAVEKTLDLDLRRENDLARSYLLHRLNLLWIPWGEIQGTARGKGTFHEVWTVQWKPEFAVSLVEASTWGNTVEEAATARALARARDAETLPALAELANQALLADLSDSIVGIMDRLQALSAVADDVHQMMDAVDPLSHVLRYGDVRKTDTEQVAHVLDGLVARMCIHLPQACVQIDEDAAEATFERIVKVHQAITLLSREEYMDGWTRALRLITEMEESRGVLRGRACRILLETGEYDAGEVARRMGLALSLAADAAQAASWLDGFLRGSGMILIHDDRLWKLVDDWVAGVSPERFQDLLPLLRRTFSSFPSPERYQMGKKVKVGPGKGSAESVSVNLDPDRANRVLPVLRRILGLPEKPDPGDPVKGEES